MTNPFEPIIGSLILLHRSWRPAATRRESFAFVLKAVCSFAALFVTFCVALLVSHAL